MSDIIVTKFGSADIEEFKRPDHPDFMTSQELKAKTFSGVRNNTLSDSRELWLNGEMVLSVDNILIARIPDYWEKSYANAVGLHHVVSTQ